MQVAGKGDIDTPPFPSKAWSIPTSLSLDLTPITRSCPPGDVVIHVLRCRFGRQLW